MVEFTSEPVEADSQDVVVDIEPTSQHGGGADLVTITTSLVSGGNIVRLDERHEVAQDGDSFSLRLFVPGRGANLAKDSPWSVLVLVPRSTDEYEVQVSFDGEPAGELLTPDAERPRRVVAWHGVQDPPLDVVWQYVRRP